MSILPLSAQEKAERWNRVELAIYPTEQEMNAWFYLRAKCGPCAGTGVQPEWCEDHNDMCFKGGRCEACGGARQLSDRDMGDETR